MKIGKSIIIAVLFLMLSAFDYNLPANAMRDLSNAKVTVGIASWYSESSPGINYHTANMEVFDDSKLTCAIWDVPFNTFVRVTNLDNGKSVIARVNDRGPAKRLVRKGRIIDLSRATFKRVANLGKGLIRVRVEFIPGTYPSEGTAYAPSPL